MQLVSVIVPTYRRLDSLKKALQSLSEQTYPNFEIIVIDDNDDAEWNASVSKIVSDFCSKHPSISLTYIANHPNQGSAKSRNIGIERARGTFVTFLDDDDLYLPNKISRQAVFMEDSHCDYSITDLFLYNEHDRLIDQRIRSYIQDTSQSHLQEYHLKYHMTGTDSLMFKRDYLLQIGGFAPIDAGDEYYLMQRAIDGDGKFGYLSGCDIKAYVHTGEGGLSSGDIKINGENALFDFKKNYFSQISAATKRYITMRHYAVLAYAELRRNHFISFLQYSLSSFFRSPIDCIRLFLFR